MMPNTIIATLNGGGYKCVRYSSPSFCLRLAHLLTEVQPCS